MEITRTKALAAGAAGLLVLAAAGAGAAYLTLSGGDELRYRTQAALRGALPATAAAELHDRGVRLEAALTCTDLPGLTAGKLGATCTGTTEDDRPVQVLGTGDLETDRSFYTILVDGEPLVENVACLGADCHRDE